MPVRLRMLADAGGLRPVGCHLADCRPESVQHARDDPGVHKDAGRITHRERDRGLPRAKVGGGTQEVGFRFRLFRTGHGDGSAAGENWKMMVGPPAPSGQQFAGSAAPNFGNIPVELRPRAIL